jgi:hypothetical protein
LKQELIAGMGIGYNKLSSTSAWKGDCFLGLQKKVFDHISVSEYNSLILFKENFFED